MLHTEWITRMQALIMHGRPVGPRGFGTREQLDRKLVLFDSRFNLLDVPERKLNYRFAVAEWVWMMFGHSAVEPIAQYNGIMRQFSDDGVWLAGAYGPHINAQRSRCLQRLRDDPASRQAVIEIPRPQGPTKDEPCTLSLQFLNRDGALHLIVTMRSSDVWLGIPYDVFTFTQIQNCFAGVLGLQRGSFMMNMGSSHLYDRDADAALHLLQENHALVDKARTLRSPDLPGLPPDWLEQVMLTRSLNAVPAEELPGCVPGSAKHPSPWLQYAETLLVKTSDEARDVLRAMSI